MGSKIETIHVAQPFFIFNRGYIPCAVKASKKCLKERNGVDKQIGMLISAAVYRDRQILEPALSSLILGKLLHKSICKNKYTNDRLNNVLAFDLNNGACGLIQALQVLDGYLQSEKIDRGLVIAGDSVRKSGESKTHSFTQGAAAILLSKGKKGEGFVRFMTDSYLQYKDDFIAYGHFRDGKSILTFEEKRDYLNHAVSCALNSVEKFLDEEKLKIGDIDLVFSSQLPNGFVNEIRNKSDLKDQIIQLGRNHRGFHTASPLFALNSIFNTNRYKTAKNILFLTISAGITTSIALYTR